MTEKTRTARFSHTISSSAKQPMRSFFLIFSITSKRYSSGNTPKNVGRQMKRSPFESVSFGYSLLGALTIGIIVASVAIILDATWTVRATTWYVRAIVIGSLQLFLVTLLVTAVLEQRRKRIIRRTLELAFLNHHIRNALTQVQLADHISDPERQHQLLQEAIERVSGVLYQLTMTGDTAALSLERDITGTELAAEQRNRERQRAG